MTAEQRADRAEPTVRSGWGRRVWGVAKIAFFAAALLFLLSRIPLNDRVRLAADPERTSLVLRRDADGLVVACPSSPEGCYVALSELASEAELPPGRFQVEPGLRSIASTAERGWVGGAFAALAGMVLLAAGRLYILLGMQGIRVPYFTLVLLTFAGNFLNFLMPGSTGGDIYKAYQLARLCPRRTEAITTVVLDRAMGMGSYLIICVGAMLLAGANDSLKPFRSPVALLAVVGVVAGLLYFSKAVRRWTNVSRLIERLPFSEQIARVDATLFRLREFPGPSAAALGLTLVNQIVLAGSLTLLALAMGIGDGGRIGFFQLYLTCLVSMSLGSLLAAIPISIHGVGVFEAPFYQLLVRSGLASTSQMVALTFGNRLLHMVWSLPGLLVAWLGLGGKELTWRRSPGAR